MPLLDYLSLFMITITLSDTVTTGVVVHPDLQAIISCTDTWKARRLRQQFPLPKKVRRAYSTLVIVCDIGANCPIERDVLAWLKAVVHPGGVAFVIDDDAIWGVRPLMMVDIVHYNDGHAARNAEKQRALLEVLDGAAAEVRLDRSQWIVQHQGDSELAVLPAGHQVAVLFTQFADALARWLTDYNRDRTTAGQVRLRMAVHRGDVVRSAAGYAGAAPGVVARMVDCAPLRTAMARLPGSPLAVAVSDEVYRAVVLGGLSRLPSEAFVPAEVRVKEFHSDAWLRAPGVSAAELQAVLATTVPVDATAPLSPESGMHPTTPVPSGSGRADAPAAGECSYNISNVFTNEVHGFHIGPQIGGR